MIRRPGRRWLRRFSGPADIERLMEDFSWSRVPSQRFSEGWVPGSDGMARGAATNQSRARSARIEMSSIS